MTLAEIGATHGIGGTGSCVRHVGTAADGACHDCGETWCAECLVPPTSRRQPLRCVACALVAAGVRPRGFRTGPVR